MSDAKTSGFFDGYAADFNEIYGTSRSPFNAMVNHFFRSSMKDRFLLSLEGCSPVAGRSVLDIGTGPGHYAVALSKGGASLVLGIDFADGMLQIARENATRAGVGENCRFIQADFLQMKFDTTFDFTIVMGLMDYMENPDVVIRKVLSVTRKRAFFSFPLDGGFLAWQRKIRYKSRCKLFLYSREQVINLFMRMNHERLDVVPLKRELFVTAHME